MLGGVALLAAMSIGTLLILERRSTKTYFATSDSVKMTHVPIAASSVCDSAARTVSALSCTKNRLLRPDTVEALTFEICNAGRDTLRKVEFAPYTKVAGRSTEFEVVQPQRIGEYASNSMSSDYLVPPGACQELTWRGKFYTADSTYAKVLYAEAN